ncbi:unnamed protein product, partial [Ectocarpus fasciculatus]
ASRSSGVSKRERVLIFFFRLFVAIEVRIFVVPVCVRRRFKSCRFAVGEFGREHSGTIEGPFAALCRESKVSSVYDVLIHARRLVD